MDQENLTAKEYAKQHGISEGFAAAVVGKYNGQEYRAEELPTMRYHWEVLYDGSEAAFITLTAIDALSIEDTLEQPGAALAIGEDFKEKFLFFIDTNAEGRINDNKRICKKPLIVAMPSDAEGLKLSEELTAELQKRDLTVVRADLTGDSKTINEALQADKAKLKEDIETAQLIAMMRPSYELRQYLKSSASAALSEFTAKIDASADISAISTGFNNLDELLDGGLYPGLYVLGAISSLGKTTLALQIIDQIAQSGQDCLIFSLEMAKEELIAKSLSRLTYQNSKKSADAKTTRGILTGARYVNYSQTEKDLIQTAKQTYGEYAQHIFIHEGVGDIGVTKIREAIEQHIKMTGRQPIVLIDYLQILAPYELKMTDKQNTDKNITELKRISRDYKLPVIGISSFNRESYKTTSGNYGKVSMTDFKESGSIEYSADVLIGLEFEAAGNKDYNEQQEKDKEPRSIRLVILKNRNGKAYGKAYFSYNPLFNHFKET